MAQFILASFCNIPTRTTSPLLCLQIPEKVDAPIFYGPVFMGYPDLASTATGLTSEKGKIFILFAAQNSSFHIAVLKESDLSPLFYQELPEIKDGHSILALDNCLYVVSTGTDEVFCYDIKEKSLNNPTMIWHASDRKTDTHHINSILEMNGDIIISAFGPKTGTLWSSASNGYIFNITTNSFIKEGIYHPHSLSVRNNHIYYSDSHRNTFCVVDQVDPIFDLTGYTRGISWLTNKLVCVATSIGRKVSKSTGLIANPADPGDPAGECGILIGDLSEKRIVNKLDLSWFGPEIYDILVLKESHPDLLMLSNTSQIAERRALQLLFWQLVENDKHMHELSVQKAVKEFELSEIYRSKAWRLVSLLRSIRVFLIPPSSWRASFFRGVLRLLIFPYTFIQRVNLDKKGM